MKWTNPDNSIQFHDAFIGHARQRHDAAKLGRLALGQFSTHVFHCVVHTGVHVLWTSRTRTAAAA